MGGVGSSNWYRFDKKTTTGECHSVDVRYLHREGLLKSGHWFSLRWSRAGRETGSIRSGVVNGGSRRGLPYVTAIGAGQAEIGTMYRSPYP